MDNRLIFLVFVLVVLLIVFGRNPMQHRKQQVFEQALEDKLNKKDLSVNDVFSNSGSSMQQNMGGQNPFATGPGQPGTAGTPTNPGMAGALRLPPQAGTTTGTGNAQQPLPNPNVQTAPTRNGGLQQQPDWPIQQQVAQAASGEAPSAPAFYLKDGRRIFFSGFSVFVMGNDGTLAPLPDGRYTMQSNDVILIRDGKRTSE